MAAIFTFLPSSIERLAKPGRPSMLPALSLCTCCRHYPGSATGGTALLIRPVMSAFPGLAAGSARASTFSRFAQRSLALRPAHSRGHRIVARLSEGFNHFVSSVVAPVLPAGAVRRVGLAPTGKRRLITAHAKSGHSTTSPIPVVESRSEFPPPCHHSCSSFPIGSVVRAF